MPQKNPILAKSYNFAVEIVKLLRKVQKDRQQEILLNQLLRSATSIGANVQEAQSTQSRADFVHKMSISLREARESLYWFNILKDSGYFSETEVRQYIQANDELICLLVAIVGTAKANKHSRYSDTLPIQPSA